MASFLTRAVLRLDRLAPLRAVLLVVLAWAASALVLFLHLGVRLGGDSGRYLGAGQALLDHQPLAGKAASYLGYDAFVALHLAAGGGPASIVAAQVVVAGIAAIALYRLGDSLYGRAAGVLAAILFAVYPSLRQWDYYVLTDSLFVSVAVLAVFGVLAARRPGHWALAAAAALFATLLRPNGVIVPFALAVLVARRLWRSGRGRVLALAAGAAVVLAWPAFDVVGHMLAHERVIAQYTSGAIVHGYLATALDVPPQLYVPPPDGNGLARVLEFAFANPGYFLSLAAAKLCYFFGRARPYFSTGHNLFVLVTLLPAYALAAVGFGVRPRIDGARVLIVSLCGLQALVVALTFADWDSRHSLLILPFVFLFAGAGLARLAGGRPPAGEPRAR